MKKTRKLLSILMVLTMVLCAFSACGKAASSSSVASAGSTAPQASPSAAPESKAYKIGFANIADTDVFCKYTMDKFVEIAEEKGWKVDTTDANLDVLKQITQVDTFIANKVDAIVIMPVDYDGAVPAIKAANDAGIPVICLIIDAAGGDFTYIGSDNYQCGQAQAEFFTEALPENAKIVYLAGTPGLNHSAMRHDGFFENFKRDDVEVVAQLAGDFEREKGMKIMEDWLQAYPQIDGVVSANDQMALGAIQALKSANRLEGVVVGGVDATENGMVSIKNGEMSTSMLYNGIKQAQNSVDTLEKIFKGEAVEKKIISPFETVAKDNVDEYMKSIYGK